MIDFLVLCFLLTLPLQFFLLKTKVNLGKFTFSCFFTALIWFLFAESIYSNQAAKICNILPGTHADRQGFQQGETIISINNRTVFNRETALRIFLANKGSRMRIKTKLGKQIKTRTLETQEIKTLYRPVTISSLTELLNGLQLICPNTTVAFQPEPNLLAHSAINPWNKRVHQISGHEVATPVQVNRIIRNFPPKQVFPIHLFHQGRNFAIFWQNSWGSAEALGLGSSILTIAKIDLPYYQDTYEQFMFFQNINKIESTKVNFRYEVKKLLNDRSRSINIFFKPSNKRRMILLPSHNEIPYFSITFWPELILLPAYSGTIISPIQNVFHTTATLLWMFPQNLHNLMQNWKTVPKSWYLVRTDSFTSPMIFSYYIAKLLLTFGIVFLILLTLPAKIANRNSTKITALIAIWLLFATNIFYFETLTFM